MMNSACKCLLAGVTSCWYTAKAHDVAASLAGGRPPSRAALPAGSVLAGPTIMAVC